MDNKTKDMPFDVDTTTTDIMDLVDDTDGIVDIPLDVINTESVNEADSIIYHLIREKYGKDYLTLHPDLKKYVDVETEGLRNLIKMRKSNETLHDILIRAIGGNSNNASLYMALSRMQGANLSIQKQIDEKMDSIRKLIKNYQAELDLDLDREDDDEEPGDETDITITRGTRDFIRQIKQEEANKQLQMDELLK